MVYSVAMVAVSVVFAPVGHMGPVYLVTALVAGAAFIGMAVALQRNPTPALAMRLFGFSITYLTVLFVAIAVDQILAKA